MYSFDLKKNCLLRIKNISIKQKKIYHCFTKIYFYSLYFQWFIRSEIVLPKGD